MNLKNMQSQCEISILVNNNPGVLSKVINLISKRGFNLERVNSERLSNDIAKIVVEVNIDNRRLALITKQLNRIIDVIKVS